VERHARSLRADSVPFPALFDPKVHPVSYLLIPRDEERIVQPMVLLRARSRGAFVFQTDAGARKLRGRAFGAIRRAGGDPASVMRGGAGALPPGTSDILGVARDGRFIAIEVKRPPVVRDGRTITAGGTPTEEQLAFLAEVWRRGGIAGVAWGPLDVDRIWAAAESNRTPPPFCNHF
jgi:hypothetical protein